MVAATVEKYVEIALPSIEVVRLVASDAETFTSRKFATVEAAQITLNEDTDADINVTDSDGTPIDGTGKSVRINVVGGTDQTCTLTLYGNL